MVSQECGEGEDVDVDEGRVRVRVRLRLGVRLRLKVRVLSLFCGGTRAGVTVGARIRMMVTVMFRVRFLR